MPSNAKLQTPRQNVLELHGAEAEEDVEEDAHCAQHGGGDPAGAHALEDAAEVGLLVVGEEARLAAPVVLV